MSAGRLDAAGWVLLVLGIPMLGNGLWMLADAARWFGAVAAVTGELNPHLVRDVGSAYVTVGVALGWAALRPAFRLPLTSVAACFLVLHALDHVVETTTGILPAHQWWEDAPSVYLPALLSAGLAVVFARRPAPQGSSA